MNFFYLVNLYIATCLDQLVLSLSVPRQVPPSFPATSIHIPWLEAQPILLPVPLSTAKELEEAEQKGGVGWV